MTETGSGKPTCPRLCVGMAPEIDPGRRVLEDEMKTTDQSTEHVEEIELQGHIIDSLILPKVLDEILTHGGGYVIKDIRVGQRQADTSFARIEVRADSAERLRRI